MGYNCFIPHCHIDWAANSINLNFVYISYIYISHCIIIVNIPDLGDRLALYRPIKDNPCTEKYLITMNSLAGRRVMARLWFGCLPLAVEVGRYTGTPYSERVCRLCDCGEVEDQHHFLIICHTFSSIRHNLFTHSLTLSSSFTHLSSYDKCKFLSLSLILQMYHLRQSLLCSN